MTVYTFPANYSSVNGDLIYTVYDAHSTDSATYPNYKYIADVYVNSTFVTRIKRVQDVSTGLGVFNIAPILRSYLTAAFDPVSGLVSQELGAGEFFLSVDVKFGEEYGYTDYLEVVTQSGVKVFNTYNGRLIGSANILSTKVDKIASGRPLTGQVMLDSSYYFIPYFPITVDPVSVTVTPTGGGASYSTTFTPSAAFNLQSLNVSPGALNALQAGTITASTTSYTVEIGDQTVTIRVICEAMYETFPVHFFNKYGGWETKLFNKVSRRSIKVERKDYGKLNYTVAADGTVAYKTENNVYHENRSIYASQFEEKMLLNSDFITDDEYTWLKDLIVSPMIYLEESGYFFPVIIGESDYEMKKAINDDLTNLTISLEFGQSLNTQYR
jgi:hypothetical protein